MKKSICVVTGTRAEYGILRNLIKKIHLDKELRLELIVTGMHLSKTFGSTYKEIEEDGLPISAKIPILETEDSSKSVAISVSRAVEGISKAYKKLQPDLILLLGDRFETFAAATAAHLSKLPIAHIHGGEITQGLMDEAFRHSITKMSQIHFVSTSEYRNRVIQLGEHPSTVFNFGSLGIENLLGMKFLGKHTLENQLDIQFSHKNLLITFHPVTLEKENPKKHFLELLKALSEYDDATLLFTYPNADVGGRVIISLIEKFLKSHPRAYAFSSLGQKRYFSFMRYADVVIGNSSSGIIEAPSLKKASINIGDRQLGRICSQSVINCAPEKQRILEALKTSFSAEFQNLVKVAVNPYEKKGTSDNILETIKKTNLNGILKKSFYDLGAE